MSLRQLRRRLDVLIRTMEAPAPRPDDDLDDGDDGDNGDPLERLAERAEQLRAERLANPSVTLGQAMSRVSLLNFAALVLGFYEESEVPAYLEQAIERELEDLETRPNVAARARALFTWARSVRTAARSLWLAGRGSLAS